MKPGKRAPNQRALLELGCGVGNCVFPLLNSNAGLFIVAVDMSRTAITILKVILDVTFRVLSSSATVNERLQQCTDDVWCTIFF